MEQLPGHIKQAIQEPAVAEQLLAALTPYLTANKQQLFEQVLPERTRHITVAVEDTYREHNASAVVRSSECFGIQDIHIIEKQHKYNVAKGIAKGSEKWVDVHIYDEEEDNTQSCIDRLRQQGYTIAAATPHRQEVTPAAYNITQPTAVFFGRELYGLSDAVTEQADHFINIPMVGFTESFNISVSAAIILYELTKRLREQPSIEWRLSRDEQLLKKLEWTIKTIQNGERLAGRYFRKLSSGS
jgi:tRNA (guanosine-2'-O-)-methyltransferase